MRKQGLSKSRARRSPQRGSRRRILSSRSKSSSSSNSSNNTSSKYKIWKSKKSSSSKQPKKGPMTSTDKSPTSLCAWGRPPKTTRNCLKTFPFTNHTKSKESRMRLELNHFSTSMPRLNKSLTTKLKESNWTIPGWKPQSKTDRTFRC